MEKDNKAKVKSVKNKNDSAKIVIINLGLLLIVLSIAYSTTVIMTATEDIIPKILVLPQALYASWVIVKKFTK